MQLRHQACHSNLEFWRRVNPAVNVKMRRLLLWCGQKQRQNFTSIQHLLMAFKVFLRYFEVRYKYKRYFVVWFGPTIYHFVVTVSQNRFGDTVATQWYCGPKSPNSVSFVILFRFNDAVWAIKTYSVGDMNYYLANHTWHRQPSINPIPLK